VKSSTSSRPRSLPSTGSNSNSFLLVASALVIGGGFLLGPIRRRSLRKS
jgi:LPXTG-motif cell wall-anchored protein